MQFLIFCLKRRPLGLGRKGFTLIELILVILLLGIIGAMGGELISTAFKGFSDTDARMELFEEGKMALMRMEREIHIALPNALRIKDDGDVIEFGVIDENVMATVTGLYSEDPHTPTLTGLPATTLISIYNTQWCNFDNLASNCLTIKSHIYTSNVSGEIAIAGIDTMSPYQRYYAVRPNAVRFCVLQDPTDSTKKNLYRGTAQVNAGAALGAFANDQLLAKNIKPIKKQNGGLLPFFTYSAGTSTRNSVVTIHFTLSNGEESVNFHKEIQVRNVP